MHKEHLHHAYLLLGEKEKTLPAVVKLMRELKIDTAGNPDYIEIHLDVFKINDARNLKSLASSKSTKGDKKIFVVSANQFLLEAQNTLLKVFEEPVPGTHFFIIMPEGSTLLPTLSSRLYKISNRTEGELKEAEKFVAMDSRARIEYLKEMLVDEDEDEDTPTLSSARTRALAFLNSLEIVLHRETVSSTNRDVSFFEQLFSVRDFLRQPGSSAKSLMESLALIIPQFKL